MKLTDRELMAVARIRSTHVKTWNAVGILALVYVFVLFIVNVFNVSIMGFCVRCFGLDFASIGGCVLLISVIGAVIYDRVAAKKIYLSIKKEYDDNISGK